MKARESGMPDEDYWQTFFDVETAIKKLFVNIPVEGSVVEFGCGYGTFTLPAARQATGSVLALDIEANLIEGLRGKAKVSALLNIQAEMRDFIAFGTGLGSASQAHAMIYNLLHLEDPVNLLREARRVLRPGGTLSVIHWRSDIPTPRGPSLDIRPTPEQCKEWMKAAGFHTIRDVDLSECCPYHYGLVAIG